MNQHHPSVANNGKSIIFSAPSGSGKTTIVRYLLDRIDNLAFSVSACSRQPRPGEIHAKDYYFLSVEEFEKKVEQQAFIEWEQVYPSCYYGTLFSELERIWQNNKAVIFDVDVVGGVNLKKKLGANALSIFVAPPSLDILEDRLRMRATENEESIRLRMEKANAELKYAQFFDHQVINEDLPLACQQARQLVLDFLNL